ncbi:STN domain-containing protein [Niabella sp. W65]|nr:STN domain-containing protein [Niabella sp. W65]MCH7363409.1 STN domain-containing protein [Niabella sp. W65]ULT39335.1 STN domain-containing protein [Niabella sp. I65]
MQKTYRRFLKRVRLVIALMLLSVIVKGQVTPLPVVSGAYTDIDIRTFLEALEKQSRYRFYYDTRKLGASKITVTFNNEPLNTALERGLKHTSLVYSIDGRGYVYISQGQMVQTSLPDWFYNGEQPFTQVCFPLEIPAGHL